MKTSIKLGLLSVISVSAFSMIACGTTAPPSELVDARAAYSRAAAGPAAQLDPADLHTAKESLDAAERQFADESDSQGTKDTSYIALRRSELGLGEPLDDLVHAQATRRLLAVRRAAALVLFEVRRREGAKSPEEVATLYRGLLQRATFALYTDEDARRWPLEADAWIHGAATLQGELLSAQLAIVLRRGAGDRSGAAAVLDHPRPDADEWEDDADGDAAAAAGATSSAPVPAPAAAAASPVVPAVEWWRSPKAGAILRQIWSLGRSASSADVLRALRLSSLDPYLLAAIAEEQLGYRAPERPPAPSKPDYKELRGDRKPRKKRKKRAR